MMKVMRKSYPTISPHYSRQLREIIAQMLNKKSNQRPSIVEILNKPFIKARVEKFMKEKIQDKSSAHSEKYAEILKEQARALDV